MVEVRALRAIKATFGENASRKICAQSAHRRRPAPALTHARLAQEEHRHHHRNYVNNEHGTPLAGAKITLVAENAEAAKDQTMDASTTARRIHFESVKPDATRSASTPKA